jgi:outer membrane protein assembly factor BamA
LRGYEGDEAQLRGANARVASMEWRFPLLDVDRHAMVPPFGIGRVSGTVLFDIGGAWNDGHRPAEYWRSVGVELLGELKLFYSTGLQLRLGAARGLDGPRETQGYLTLGRSF